MLLFSIEPQFHLYLHKGIRLTDLRVHLRLHLRSSDVPPMRCGSVWTELMDLSGHLLQRCSAAGLLSAFIGFGIEQGGMHRVPRCIHATVQRHQQKVHTYITT